MVGMEKALNNWQLLSNLVKFNSFQITFKAVKGTPHPHLFEL